jgi:hypothetical protein
MGDDAKTVEGLLGLLALGFVYEFIIRPILMVVGAVLEIIGAIVGAVERVLHWLASPFVYLFHTAWFQAVGAVVSGAWAWAASVPWNWLAALPASSWPWWAQLIPVLVAFGLAEVACWKDLFRPLPRRAKLAHAALGIVAGACFFAWLIARLNAGENIPLWMFTFPALTVLPMLAYAPTLDNDWRLAWSWVAPLVFIGVIVGCAVGAVEEFQEWRGKHKGGNDDFANVFTSMPFGDDPRSGQYEAEQAGILRKM